MKISRKILMAAGILALLLAAFFLNGNSPAKADTPGKAAAPVTAAADQQGAQTALPEQNPTEDSVSLPAENQPEKGNTPAADSPEQTGPAVPEDAKETDTAYICTISIRCDTLLDNMDTLDAEKRELVPQDGVVLSTVEATFYEGESVFDVLRRETKRAGVHMEYVDTPIYNSAYIEGIGNLYEFDCGEGSGWMYEVDGWFPNYGSSRYSLKDGDVIEWVFTCDLGEDVGGGYAGGQQRE